MLHLSTETHSVSICSLLIVATPFLHCVISTNQGDQSEGIKHGRRCAGNKGTKPTDKEPGKVRKKVKLEESENWSQGGDTFY